MCGFRNAGESRNTVQRHNTFSEPAGQQNKLQMRQKRGSLSKPPCPQLTKRRVDRLPAPATNERVTLPPPHARNPTWREGLRKCGTARTGDTTFAQGHRRKNGGGTTARWRSEGAQKGSLSAVAGPIAG
mmetsp:Transcript_18350/g.44198  ORF Transcript_18350/g.44198 Transcript_18350/m.44198 type:complete len:129 (-) Transcript_18350:1153-1539(-)